MTDDQLIRGCIKNNIVAQRHLYENYHPKMLGVCIRYAANRDEAQDILQDGFIKVFKNIHSFKRQGSLEGWIRKIMVNTALENYRKTIHLRQNIEIETVEGQLESEGSLLEDLHAEDILRFIHQLPQGYRMVFNLFAIEGYKHEEIAEKLSISVNTSYSQYHRARALLRKLILSEKKTTAKQAI